MKCPVCGRVTDCVWRTRAQLIVVGLIKMGRALARSLAAHSVISALEITTEPGCPTNTDITSKRPQSYEILLQDLE